MTRRYLLPLLAAVGIGIAVAVAVSANREPSSHAPAVTPAAAPYASFVAGAGLVEASTGNIAIGSPIPGVAREVDVRVGDRVDAGDVLFRIDDRDLQAQLLTAAARVKTAEAALQQPQHELEYSQQLRREDPTAVSARDLTRLRDEVTAAEAGVGLAKAQVARLNEEIERRTVRAPVAGRVLRLTLRVGEYVDGGSAAAPVLLFGDDEPLYVRVDVDESDAWRVRPGAAATAFVRGNPNIEIPLQFEYIEPDIVPKMSLTGRSTERTDTRVLQVLYSFPPNDLPVHVGQQLDVFIEAAPAAQ